MLEMKQAVKFVTDDVIKIPVESRILLRQNPKLGISQHNNSPVIIKPYPISRNIFRPSPIFRDSVIVAYYLFFAVDGVNQINNAVESIRHERRDVVQGKV